MKLKPTYRMPFKRRKMGKTDYKRRLRLLFSKKPRLVVRRSLKYIRAQIIEFDKSGDKTLVAASSQELKKLGWDFPCDNLPAAYLTGLLIGKKTLQKNIKDVVLDVGLYPSRRGNRIYAVAKGVIDSGLKVPLNEEILPSEERIKGLHIQKFKNLSEEVERIKQKILGG